MSKYPVEYCYTGYTGWTRVFLHPYFFNVIPKSFNSARVDSICTHNTEFWLKQKSEKFTLCHKKTKGVENYGSL